MMKNKRVKQVLYWLTVAILAAIIIVCSVLIARKLIGDQRNKELNTDIGNIKQSELIEASKQGYTQPNRLPPPSTSATLPTDDTVPPETEPTVPTEPSILFGYRALYELNNDMVGWLEIPGTSIDLPVVQTPNSINFYLRKNFYKEKATCGTLYVREKCDVFAPSDNVTIYGHNMRNGTMFADLHLYEKKDFWEKNKYVYFDTLYEYHTYEIFAVFITSADKDKGFRYHLFSDARTATEFDEFVATCKDLSLYDTGITPQYGEKLLTLSTCDKSIEDGRLVVVARRVL